MPKFPMSDCESNIRGRCDMLRKGKNKKRCGVSGMSADVRSEMGYAGRCYDYQPAYIRNGTMRGNRKMAAKTR